MMSKKMPGITIVCSLRSSSKNVCVGVSASARSTNARAYQAVVERGREVLEVEPDVESRLGWHGDLEAETLQTLEDVVALRLEVPLQGNLLLLDMFRVEEREGSELQARSRAQIVREVTLLSREDTYGWLAPPSRKEPDCDSAVMRFLGPTTQQTRKPGRRQF